MHLDGEPNRQSVVRYSKFMVVQLRAREDKDQDTQGLRFTVSASNDAANEILQQSLNFVSGLRCNGIGDFAIVVMDWKESAVQFATLVRDSYGLLLQIAQHKKTRIPRLDGNCTRQLSWRILDSWSHNRPSKEWYQIPRLRRLAPKRAHTDLYSRRRKEAS